MATTDRLSGLSLGTVCKAACTVATTGAAITLEGAQTIDGVAVGSSERVLVKDQADASKNGIYSSNSSTWTRASDCDGAKDLIPGSWVYVDRGTANATKFYVFNSSSTAIDVDIDTDDIDLSDITPSLTGVSAFSNDLLALTSGAEWRSSDGLWLGTGATEDIALGTTQSWTAANRFIDGLNVYSTSISTAEQPGFNISNESSAPADDQPVGALRFKATNSTNNSTTYGKWLAWADDITAATEDGHLEAHTIVAGTLANRLGIGAGVYTGGATDAGAGTFNSSLGPRVRGRDIEWQTTDVIDLTSSSPTAVTLLDSLSTDVSEIEIQIEGASIAQATAIAFKVGDAGGVESSGYSGRGWSQRGDFAMNANSTGFLLGDQTLAVAARTIYGTARFSHLGSNVWSFDGISNSSTALHGGHGTKTLSAPLDRVEITTIANVSTFDAGQAYMRYR